MQVLGEEVTIDSPDSSYAQFVFPHNSSEIHIQLQVKDNEQAFGLDTVVIIKYERSSGMEKTKRLVEVVILGSTTMKTIK